jgi:ABC-type nitrate/sulfonate/bicarbonate transport system substrate-binding protein
VDRGEVKLEVIKEEKEMWQAVQQGKVDGAIVPAPGDLYARRAGLKVVKLDPLPMIEFTTFSSGLPFVEKHPDIVERFIKGTVEGMAYFKTHRKEAIQIIKDKFKTEGAVDDELANYLYDELDERLLRKPYPNMKGVLNAYEESVRQDKAAAKVNPMELWDFHFLRRIDDSGFIEGLYRN